jgi:hypothetical protein
MFICTLFFFFYIGGLCRANKCLYSVLVYPRVMNGLVTVLSLVS